MLFLLLSAVPTKGIVSFSSEVQPLNAPAPIEVTERGTDISVNVRQSLNALPPIDFTPSGIETLLRL